MGAINFVDTGTTILAYQHDGALDAPALVLINPLGSDMRIWDAVVPHFVGSHAVIRFDKRGHGLSSAPSGEYRVDDFTADVIALMDLLGIQAAALAGASIGGLIALSTAHHNPQRVRSLVLCDTAAKLGTADYWQQRMDAVAAQGLQAMSSTILERWFAPDYHTRQPAAYQGYLNMLSRTDEAGYAASCAALRDADLRDVLPTIEQQALVICGAQDCATPPDVVKPLAEALPNATFELIPEAGHTVSVEQPAYLAEAMQRFLKPPAGFAPHTK